jgi:cation:H+ antiporter
MTQGKSWALVAVAIGSLLPGVALSLGGIPTSDPVRAALYGVAIIGAALVLSWVAEVVQLDFSQGLALALLALIAILPEYVVDASYAWLAAEDTAYAGYGIANMTVGLLGAAALFGLFVVQMLAPQTRGRITMAYFGLSAVALVLSRRQVRRAFQWIRT